MVNKKNNKLAFTLAEIMIVFTLIAVITGIILPIAFQSAPDEEAMKFQKANTALMTAIRELVNSNKYHKDGDLAKMPDGSLVTNPKYLCNALGDIINTKSTNCTDTNLGYNSSAAIDLADIKTYNINSIPIYDYIDCLCNNNQTTAEIITEDDVSIYILNPYYHFGSKTNTGTPENDKRIFNLCSDTKRYKTLCLDIDGLNKGEPPFGYALRADGKIIYGSRANAWIERGVQKKDQDDSTISFTDSCSPLELSITPENDECQLRAYAQAAPPAINPTPSEPEEGGEETPEEEPVGCGDLAMEIELGGTKYCITKYNIGDKPELPLPSTITILATQGDTCNLSGDRSLKCCWQGTTSADCNAENGGYSGCNRSVCSYSAASEVCSKLTYRNKTWRLITPDEATLIKNLGAGGVSEGKGASGLQTCDEVTTPYQSAICKSSVYCLGASSNMCLPARIHLSGDKSLRQNYGVYYIESYSPTQPASVRCIAEL